MTDRVRKEPDAPDLAGDAPDAAAPMDFLLTDAAVGVWRRFLPGWSGLRLAGSLLADPARTARQTAGYAGDLTRIAMGRSDLAPGKRDRRFADEAWSRNPVLHRLMQAYLRTGAAARTAVSEADLPWRDHERMTFVVDNLVEAAAPSNVPALNPLTWKAIRETKGRSVLAGTRNFLSDMSAAPRVPSMVDPSAFAVGKTLGLSRGSVVHTDELFELIQYTPTTDMVGSIPLLVVPPVINKFYLLDLAPGRSLIEYLVGQGVTVFAISWRNPGKDQRDKGFDDYGRAIIGALDVAAEITGEPRAHLLSLCSGGALASMTAAHLAAGGHGDRVATFSLGVSVLDQNRAGTPAALADPAVVRAAVARSAAKGYLDGESLAEIFAWLRPSDLIWNYWVNNYLQGRKPPAFDILYWNADTTRMTAALHRDFIELFTDNRLTTPGAARMLGTPVDLGAVTADSYIVAGVADHICPWQSCYRSTALLGGDNRFVLSTAGHVASMVNPADSGKSTFRTNDENPADPQDWLAGASMNQGSWWLDYARWLAERTPRRRRAPRTLGSKAHPAGVPAPGRYVMEH